MGWPHHIGRHNLMSRKARVRRAPTTRGPGGRAARSSGLLAARRGGERRPEGAEGEGCQSSDPGPRRDLAQFSRSRSRKGTSRRLSFCVAFRAASFLSCRLLTFPRVNHARVRFAPTRRSQLTPQSIFTDDSGSVLCVVLYPRQ